jgi:hypothetical protein
VSERASGIEVAGSTVRVAVAERRQGVTRLLGIEERTGAADAGAAAAAAGRSTDGLGALPLAATTHRVLALPFSDARALAQTVPLELAGQLPVEPSDARVGFEVLARVGDGAQVLAFMARERDLDAVVATARGAGAALLGITIAPLALRWLLPDGFSGNVLVADGSRTTLAVWRAGRPAALRACASPGGDHAAVAAEVAWSLPLLGGDVADGVVVGGADAPRALSAALDECGLPSRSLAALLRPDLGLAPDTIAGAPVACGLALGALARPLAVPFPQPRHAGRPLLTPRLARLAAVAAGLAVLNLGLVRTDLARRARALERAIGAEAARVLPDERLVAPRTQLEAELADLRAHRSSLAYGTALARLREVSARVPAGLPVDLARFALDGEQLQLVGDAATFEAVDALRRALAGSARLRDVTADEVRTAIDGQRVSFRLRARWVAYGETPS